MDLFPRGHIDLAVALADDERVAAEGLLAACSQFEGIELPVNLNPSDDGRPCFILARQDGALLGLARLEFGVELYVAVHPEHRRRGVGRALTVAARAECARRGHGALLLVCDEASASGMAFAAALAGLRAFAEYAMELDSAAVDRSRPRDPALRLRPAGEADLETLVHLQAAAFGDPPEAVRLHVADGLRRPSRQYFIGERDGEAIGLLRVGRYEEFADVTAFGVLPERQGQGYGRQMLLDAVDLLLGEGWERITIDVETDNRGALGLYRACGFRERRTYGYYRLEC